MRKNVVAFVEFSYNRYSLAVLTGLLEEDTRFTNTDIVFLKSKKNTIGNTDFNSNLFSEIFQLSKTYNKVVVGFSFHTPNILTIGETIRGLKQLINKKRTKNVFVVAGGPHPSGDPIGTLEMGTDVVVVGEGEISFPALLECYFSGDSFNEVKGISYIGEDGKYHYTGRPIPIDLSNYAAFAPKHKRFSPIEISRGCPWGCKFCQTPFLMGGKMRHRSIESIVHYAKIAKKHGIRDLRFITPVSLAYGSHDGKSVNLPVLEEMLASVNEIFGKEHVFLGSFPSEVRPENITPKALRLIKKYCANDNIIIGAQSGSETMLSEIHRGHGVSEITTATRLIIEQGFIANIDFIFGMPGENEKDIQETIKLMKELTSLGARVHSHTFMPLVGTPFSKGKPGKVDERTRDYLEKLRGKGLEYGDWKKQEVIAIESIDYIAKSSAERPQELKIERPLKPQ
jgi:B12-binding domain/radical SAM domain protein